MVSSCVMIKHAPRWGVHDLFHYDNLFLQLDTDSDSVIFQTIAATGASKCQWQCNSSTMAYVRSTQWVW